MARMTQRITPFLWFDGRAEEAANLYVSLFENSRITSVTRYGEEAARASGNPAGSVMTVAFELAGQEFVALNGGPLFKFTEAISFVVSCETQAEIDHFWGALSAGGHESQCGWLKDRFGVSWQVVPAGLGDLLQGDGGRGQRVMAALLTMRKIELGVLRDAWEGPVR